MIRVDGPDAAGVARVVLSRAAKRNALTPEMLGELIAGVLRLGAYASCGAIVVGGEGAVFCSGFDLSLCRDSADGSVMRALLRGLSGAVRAMHGAACPVVVAAHGAAIAGGCALLGGADIVVADAGCRMGYPVLRLGVSPAVSAPFMRLGVGDGATRARMLDTELIDGREGRRIGLVHELVAGPEDVFARAEEIARDLAGKPPGGVRTTKAWLNEVDDARDRMDDRAERALGASLSLAGTAEEKERLDELWSKRG